MSNPRTPAAALATLEEGNNRFVNNLKLNRDLSKEANEAANGQFPFAIFVSCIDSRTSVEIVFDLGIGNVFNARIAGAVVNPDILGSIEFACKAAGATLIVVLGHSQCGAVRGACDNVTMGNLTGLLSKIQPAIKEETYVVENRTSTNPAFVERVTANHVRRTIDIIMRDSPVLKRLIDDGECGIIGGHHDIVTRKVNFYPETKHGFFNPKLPIAPDNQPPKLKAKL